MKTLTAGQMVDLLPSDPGELLHLFDAVAPSEWQEHTYLRRAIAEGMCEAVTVRVNGEPAWMLGCHPTDDGGLWIDLAHTLKPGNPIEALLSAIDLLAAQRGRRYVRCVIKRRGFIRLAETHGYKAEGILLVKQNSTS